MTEDKKIKSLIGFLSANKIDNYNGAGGRGKKEKKSKRIYQKNQKIRIINIFLESKKKKEILEFVKEPGRECVLSWSLPDSSVSRSSPIKGFSSQTGLIENAKGW